MALFSSTLWIIILVLIDLLVIDLLAGAGEGAL
jgi:hypothetical protein